MTGKRAVKEEVVEKVVRRKGLVIEVMRMIEGREAEIAEIDEKDEVAEKAEMTGIIGEVGMKEMTEKAGESQERAKTQKERQRVVIGREIVVQEA